MTLEDACAEARRRRDLYDMDVHVLQDTLGKYFTILEINKSTFLNSILTIDKKIYYTAWKFIGNISSLYCSDSFFTKKLIS